MSESSHQFAGLILAGGKSHRMGQDKSQLLINGYSLLERSVKLLEDAGCSEVIVSSDVLDNAVRDRFSGIGPVAGIESGMEHLLRKGIQGRMVILPVDMPLLMESTIRQLLGALDEYQAARFVNNPLPLAITLTERNYHHIERIAQGAKLAGGISIKAMCHDFKSTTIEPTADQLPEFFNCNNPDDFAQLLNLI